MYRIAVCDNEKSMTGQIETRILELSCKRRVPVQVEVFFNGEDLIDELDRDYYDAIYLKMEMWEENGIQIASRIRERDEEALILFISEHKHYMEKAFEVGDFRYISNPMDHNTFERYFDAVIKKLSDPHKYFYFTYCKRNFRLNISDILYFQSDRKLIYIIAKQGTYKCYQKLNEIEEQLQMENTGFWRIHKSLLINPKHIISYAHGTVGISDGTIFNIAEGRRKTISEFVKNNGEIERYAI